MRTGAGATTKEIATALAQQNRESPKVRKLERGTPKLHPHGQYLAAEIFAAGKETERLYYEWDK